MSNVGHVHRVQHTVQQALTLVGSFDCGSPCAFATAGSRFSDDASASLGMPVPTWASETSRWQPQPLNARAHGYASA
eukprot:5520655-Amphidinium_carterae.1